MKVLSSGCFKGSRAYNDDIIGILNNMWYVCDGSTALFNNNKFSDTSDLSEYMQMLNKEIKNDGDISLSIKNAIVRVNEQLPALDEYQEYELPTYTVAGICEQDDKLLTYILCDCLISILFKDGSVLNLEDRRIDPSKIECIEGKKSIMALDGISDDVRKDLLLKNEQTIRMGVNKNGGYPVGSTKPESLDQGYNNAFYKKDIDRVLICSDGYYDGLGSVPSDKNDFEKDVVEERVQKILAHEKRDDMSYILLEVER
ncbi:MAG: hypothetical protein IJ475_03720 [Bacilli bacterium]|nr:hypothetical protein [Bacilli bacterium]